MRGNQKSKTISHHVHDKTMKQYPGAMFRNLPLLSNFLTGKAGKENRKKLTYLIKILHRSLNV